MGSSEGEAFLLREPVAVEGAVEAWMTAVENEMSNSLRSIAKEGVYCYANEERQEWITRVLGMVSLVGSQIWWTWEVRHRKNLMHVHHMLLSKALFDRTVDYIRDRLWLFAHSSASPRRVCCSYSACLAVQPYTPAPR